MTPARVDASSPAMYQLGAIVQLVLLVSCSSVVVMDEKVVEPTENVVCTRNGRDVSMSEYAPFGEYDEPGWP